jgi:hypothetical protein
VSPKSRSLLKKLRKAIHALVPQAEECISYRLPAFRFEGIFGNVHGLLILPVQRNDPEDARGGRRGLPSDQGRTALRPGQATAHVSPAEAPQGENRREVQMSKIIDWMAVGPGEGAERLDALRRPARRFHE